MSTPVAAVLTLSHDNPSNTTIFDADNKALYTVHTEHGKSATTTRVLNAEDVELAALEWREVLPDRVTLAGGKGPMSLREWLHTSLVPFYLKDDVTFKDERGRKYKWRGNAPGRKLELFTEEDGFKVPIAKFVRSRKDPKTGTLAPANLLFTARALELRDDVVCSFLFLEKTRRVNETTSQRSADVLATPALSALTGHDYNVSNAGVP